MPFSCSDFSSSILNHLFDNGLLPASIIESDDLAHQATAAMTAISELALRAGVPMALATGSVPLACPEHPRSLSGQFMEELLEANETLTAIAECNGNRTLADCMYMLSAVQKGTFIEIHHPTESKILDILRALPSAAVWLTYVNEVAE